MVDVVPNHVAPVGHDYSSIMPFNREEHFHPECEMGEDQWSKENCRLSGLPDLAQENAFVKDYLKNNYVTELVKKYSFDAIRMDAVGHVPKWFWREFSQSPGIFQVGECFNGMSDFVGDY